MNTQELTAARDQYTAALETATYDEAVDLWYRIMDINTWLGEE